MHKLLYAAKRIILFLTNKKYWFQKKRAVLFNNCKSIQVLEVVPAPAQTPVDTKLFTTARKEQLKAKKSFDYFFPPLEEPPGLIGSFSSRVFFPPLPSSFSDEADFLSLVRTIFFLLLEVDSVPAREIAVSGVFSPPPTSLPPLPLEKKPGRLC